MQLEDYQNASQRYQLWNAQRIVSDPQVPLHIFYGTKLDTTCAMDYTNKRFPNWSPVESKFIQKLIQCILRFLDETWFANEFLGPKIGRIYFNPNFFQS